MGVDPEAFRADPAAIRAGFGIVDDDAAPQVTYRDLQARRALIRKRLGNRR